MMTMSKDRYVYRDAITGKFISKEYAEAYPRTTVKERMKQLPEDDNLTPVDYDTDNA